MRPQMTMRRLRWHVFVTPRAASDRAATGKRPPRRARSAQLGAAWSASPVIGRPEIASAMGPLSHRHAGSSIRTHRFWFIAVFCLTNVSPVLALRWSSVPASAVRKCDVYRHSS